MGRGRQQARRQGAMARDRRRSRRSRTTPFASAQRLGDARGRPSSARRNSIARVASRRQRDAARRAPRATRHGHRSAVRARRARRRGSGVAASDSLATAHAFLARRPTVARDPPCAEADRRGPARRARPIGSPIRSPIATSWRATRARVRSIRRSSPALIRQESSFNAHAVSVAGARGLMQVLPSVGEDGRALARLSRVVRPRCSPTPTRIFSSAPRTSRRTSSSTARCRACSPRTTPAARA